MTEVKVFCDRSERDKFQVLQEKEEDILIAKFMQDLRL